MASAWIEEDSQGILGAPGSVIQFLEGFAVPGDSGWALRGSVASFSLRAVSGFRRVVTLDLSVPPAGGRVRILEARGPESRVTAVVDSILPGGKVSLDFVVAGSRLTRDETVYRIRWDPPGGPRRGTSHLVVRDARVSPDGSRLATVSFDSTANRLNLGPGCALRLYVQPGTTPSISGEVNGVDGSASIMLRTDESGVSMVWMTRLSGDPVPFAVDLNEYAGDGIAEISLETSRMGSGAEWSKVALSGFAGAPIEIRGTPAREPFASTDTPRNVILYLIDTVRRDHLQSYGYDLPTTPHLAADSSSWLVFEDCQSLSSWTKASTASLLTGLSPIEHSTIDEDDVLPTDVELIWESLRKAGYTTALLSTNGHISRQWGFARGLDCYHYFQEDPLRPGLHCPADSIHRALLQWLDSRSSTSKPFFAYLHATDPHIPYVPPTDLIPLFYPPGVPVIQEVSVRRLNQMMCPGRYEPWELAATQALYDAEIAGWERSFALLLDALEARGLLETTAIFLTSDHGEEFAEHGGFSHGTTLYGEQVRIPLMARVPQTRGGRSAAAVDHRDVVDMIRWVAMGKDLRKWWRTPRSLREAHLSLRGVSMARLQMEQSSTIWNIRPLGLCERRLPALEFFEDRLERKDMFQDRVVSGQASRAALAAWLRRLPASPHRGIVLDQENIERLRVLGYMTDDLGS